MAKMKSDDILVYALLGVGLVVMYMLFIGPALAKPISVQGGGQPDVDVVCAVSTGATDSSGAPIAEVVACGISETGAIIGGQKVDFIALNSTATASADTTFNHIDITAATSDATDITADFENDGGAVGIGARQSGVVTAGTGTVFSTYAESASAASCGVAGLTCDSNELQVYIGDKCTCWLAADDHVGNPRTFTVSMTGNYNIGATPQTTPVQQGQQQVVIQPNPSGGFNVAVSLFSR